MEATPIYPKRNLWAAARDAVVWLSGPVSERGASRGFRISVHMGGRMLHERRLAMRAHPFGRRSMRGSEPASSLKARQLERDAASED